MARLFIYQSSFISQLLDLIYWMVTIFIFDGVILQTSHTKCMVQCASFWKRELWILKLIFTLPHGGKKSVRVNMLSATDAHTKTFCLSIMILVHKVQLDSFHRYPRWNHLVPNNLKTIFLSITKEDGIVSTKPEMLSKTYLTQKNV